MRMLIIAALAAGQVAPDDTPDIQKLQGEWETAASVVDGKPMRALGQGMKIEGDQLNYLFRGKVLTSGTIALDPKKKPKELTLTPSDPGKPDSIGIYELDGDVLKLCLSADSRPNAFESNPGDRRMFAVYKRKK